MSKSKKFRWIFVLLLILPIACYVGIYLLSESRFWANRNNADDTLQAFAYSLAYNRLESIDSYLVEEKWPFIDNWYIRHKPVSSDCTFPNDPDLGPTSGIVESMDEASGGFYFFLQCSDSDEDTYMFSVHNVRLQRIEGRWKIVEWDQVCETKNRQEECFNN